VALPVTLNRNYRLRVESVGTRHRVYADGVKVLDVIDASHASGRVALLTYRSAAEFDNVLVTPAPGATLWATGQPERPFSYYWTTSGPGLWDNDATLNGARLYSQSSVAGDARAAIGVASGDQTVETRVRATTFAGTGGGDRWFGAMARYTSESNYYYLSLRSSGTVSLRKVVNGAVTVLGTASLPVTVGRWYQLRLEAVGSRLRGYVDGNLVLETTDTAHPQGKTGMVTYRTAAQFAGYRAVRP
jgi:pectate lyase